MMTETMLGAALDYAWRGWPVFPLHSIINGRCTCEEGAGCHSPGKHPRIVDWPNQATTDPATIRQWWTRWPGANIGIPTGKASRFFVLDGDPRNGGDDTLRELEAKYGALPSTVESQTGGGGFHKLFKYPGPIKSGAGVLGHGLDIRGDGGYIVAPQSLHASGRRYEWEVSSHPDDVAIAEAPTWLLPMLTAKANGNGHEQRTDWLTLLQGVPKGGRYGVATRIAGHFLGIGRPVEEVETLILGYLSQCIPPGDAEEREKARRMVRDFAAKDAATGAADRQASAIPDDVVIVRLADVKPEPVTWLWPGRIPMGKVTLLDGDPGLGKSCITCDLAARVSTGSVMPDGSQTQPGGAVILTLEDGLADTVVPRLTVAGADLAKIITVQGVKSKDGKLRVPTVEDVEALARACQQVKAKIVIIDPLMAYLPSQRNSWRDQDVRQALAPLAKMAEEIGVAAVVIRHLNKSGGSQSIYRGGGSIGIIGAARSALLVAKDPESEDRRVLAAIKNNLAPIPSSLTFHLDTVNEAARIVWEGVSSHSADALLAAPVSQEEKSATEEAVEFLQTILEKGPVEPKQVLEAAKKAGIAERTLKRAKDLAGVVSKRAGFGEGSKWFWSVGCQATSKSANIYNGTLREEMALFDLEEV